MTKMEESKNLNLGTKSKKSKLTFTISASISFQSYSKSTFWKAMRKWEKTHSF